MYECSICYSTYESADDLANHIRSMHMPQSVPSYECALCGERFTDDGNLFSHMNGSHPVR